MRRALTHPILLSLLSALLLLALSPGHALAASSEELAAEEYAKAIQLYNAGRNREAIAAFERAITHSPQPVYFCNRAVVLLTLEEHARAIEDLTRCRDTYEMEPQELALVSAQLDALTLVERGVKRRARQIAAQIADRPTPTPIPTPIQPETPPPRQGSAARTLGWVSLALGTSALTSALTLSAVSQERVTAFGRDCQQPPSPAPSCAEDRAILRQRQAGFWGLAAGSAVLGITGIVILRATRSRDESPDTTAAEVTLTPAISAERAGLLLQFSF